MSAIIDPVVRQVDRTDARVEISLTAPDDLLYFQGHFPGYPILPGVVQLHWAIQFARTEFFGAAMPAQVTQVKFRKPVQPRDELILSLTKSADDRASFEYRGGPDICSAGQIRFSRP